MLESGAAIQEKILPLEHYVFLGLKSKLQDVFKARVVIGNSTDDIRKLQQSLGGKAIEYPYLFCRCSSMQLSENTYRGSTLSRRGRLFRMNLPEVSGRLRVLPVDFTFEVTYKDNSSERTTQYGKLWMFAVVNGGLKYTVAMGSVTYDIDVVPDKSVTLPIRDAQASEVAEYTGTSNIVVRGYVSSNRIEQQDRVLQIDVDTYADTDTVSPATETRVNQTTIKV